jgi:hypothetical protein
MALDVKFFLPVRADTGTQKNIKGEFPNLGYANKAAKR